MPFSPARITEIRSQLPAVTASAYLNTGTCGPLPLVAAEAMAQAAREELVYGRGDVDGYLRLAGRIGVLRSQLAAVIGAHATEIAFVHNTTEGINIVVSGYPWRVGDKIVTTSLEHSGALIPLYQAHRRYRLAVTFVDIGDGGADRVLDGIARALRCEPKLLVVSHVCYGTGAVLPVAEITKIAHDVGCRVLVDGAQSVGAIPVDVAELGVDYYAFPGQKWLCGPEGTGALFLREDLLESLEPTMPGSFSVDLDEYRQNDPSSLAFTQTAARFESASLYRPAVAGLSASTAWLDRLGWPNVYSTVHERTRYARERIGEIGGAVCRTPADAYAGLVSLSAEGLDAAECVRFLTECKVSIRYIPDNGALRLSCGFFTTEEDIDRAISLIESRTAAP